MLAMFGFGPMEMLLGGLCCSGVSLGGVGALVVILMRRQADGSPVDHIARLEAENRQLREQLAQRDKEQS